MRTRIALLVLLVAGCGSIVPTAKIEHPEIQLRQSSSLPSGARHVRGGIAVSHNVLVHNIAPEPIHLDRVTLQSVGEGAYSIEPITHPIDRDIAPGATESFPIMSPAVTQGTISGANGPVTVRLMLFFSTKDGKFQDVLISNVSGHD